MLFREFRMQVTSRVIRAFCQKAGESALLYCAVDEYVEPGHSALAFKVLLPRYTFGVAYKLCTGAVNSFYCISSMVL